MDPHTPGNDEDYQVHSFKFEVDTGAGTFSSITSYLDRYVQRRTPTNTEAAFVIDIYTGGLNVNFARGVFDSSGAENCFIPCNGAALVPFFGEQNASFTNVFMAPFPDGDQFLHTIQKYQEQLKELLKNLDSHLMLQRIFFGSLEHSLKILLTKDLQI